MSTRMTQFRYYADGNPNNCPYRKETDKGWNWSYYCTSENFKKYSPILSLGVQTLPGTKIYINNSYNPIIIGSSGIFELDVTNTSASINNIRVDEESMKLIKDLPDGYIIIDMVYEEQEDIEV